MYSHFGSVNIRMASGKAKIVAAIVAGIVLIICIVITSVVIVIYDDGIASKYFNSANKYLLSL